MATIGGLNTVKDGLTLYLDAANLTSYSNPNTFINNIITSSLSYNFVGNIAWEDSTKSLLHTAPLLTDPARYTISPSISYADTEERTFDFLLKWNGGVASLFGGNSTSPWCSLQSSGNTWRIRYRQPGGVYVDMSYIDYSQIDVRNWTYYTFVFKSNREIDLYISGKLITTFVCTTTQLTVSRIMGGYSSGGNVYDWNGNFSLSRFYNRALTQQEILQNYNAVKGRFNL